MSKLLTISIAAYNVEKYIRNALDSCIVKEILDEIEILVIDDGATDMTKEIVREYEKIYPKTIHLINKENGGYGTTVNQGMKEAQGKYFRLLDGDDWFDKNGLKKLVSFLRSTEVDAVLTKMYKCYPQYRELEEDTWKEFAGSKMKLDEVPSGIFAGMWEFTIKTEILKEHTFELPGKILYTDHLFLSYPIPYINEVQFLDFPLYCYRLGYDEQSVSKSVRIKHVEDIIKVSLLVSKYYDEVSKKSNNSRYALERTRFCFMEAYRAILILPCSYKVMKKLKEFDLQTEKQNRDVYIVAENSVGGKSLEFIRKTGYWGYFCVKLKYYVRSKIKVRF